MTVLELRHVQRAVADVAAYGDNDVLPFDVDTTFVSDSAEQLADLVFSYGSHMEKLAINNVKAELRRVQIFSERLLAPVGASGFRVTTKIHPFWNIYLNSICIAIAEIHEPLRSSRVHSYRYVPTGDSLFNRDYSWRKFREDSLDDCSDESAESKVVVQTDISSFYEHVSHHRLENYLSDLLPSGSNIPVQVIEILKQLTAGRSFGLPVGGQGSRMLSEVLLSSIDRTLTTAGVTWRRYVDDFVLIADSQREAYKVLGTLANALAGLGLSLSRTKTTFLSSLHYQEYVKTQLKSADSESNALMEIDLHFDPYSDTADSDYEELKEAVEGLDIRRLLAIELEKGQPDNFMVTQISRALRLMKVDHVLDVCRTLLDSNNLHSFRASWSSIMRGIAAIRANDDYSTIFDEIDLVLDLVVDKSSHLVTVDTNALHYLRTIRFARTERRAAYVFELFKDSKSATIRRACIDCWRIWQDRDRFIELRNNWSQLNSEEQRLVWLAANSFGDDGSHFQSQVQHSIAGQWALGTERAKKTSFADLFVGWVHAST